MSFYDFASPGGEAVDALTAEMKYRDQLKRQALLDELAKQNVQSQIADRESNRRIQEENAKSLAANRQALEDDRKQKQIAGVTSMLSPGQDITGTSATSVLPGFLQRTEGGATLPSTQISDAGTKESPSQPDASVPTRQVYTGTPQQVGMKTLSDEMRQATEGGKPLDRDQITQRVLDIGVPIDQAGKLVDELTKHKTTAHAYIFDHTGKLVNTQDILGDKDVTHVLPNPRAEGAGHDPNNPINQEKLEQQYRTLATRQISSRSGGLGLEDQKVNQAKHLIQLFDQNYDAPTKSYHIPTSNEHEVALGLARLLSPNGQVGTELESKIHQGTSFADAAKLLSHITGIPLTGNTQAVLRMYLDSIVRQAGVAEQNREGYFDQIRAMAPYDLEDSRVERINEGLRKANSTKGMIIRGYNDKSDPSAKTSASGGSGWFSANAPGKGK